MILNETARNNFMHFTFSILASMMMVSPPSEAVATTTDCSNNNNKLDTVKSFIQHLDVEINYNDAAKYLTDDFAFKSPKYNCKSKDQWMSTFPEFHKNSPTFEPPMFGDEAAVVTRKGVVKFGLLRVSLMETYDFDDMGLIKSIAVKRL